MKFISKLAVLICLITMSIFTSNAQVSIGASTYTSLGAAFTAINAGTHTGAITVTITGNCSESAAAVLNASGDGSASYTSVLIYPTGTYTISGSIANGLIQLNGADNVTIDGRTNQSGTSRNLTISNSSTSGACIWLDSNTTTTTGKGASYNTIKYCNIVGASNSTSTTYGIVLSSAAGITTGTAGNDNNEFSYNNIGGVYYGIRLYGTATTTPGASWVNGNKVKYNTFGSTSDATKAPYYCIYNYYAWGTEISYNEFYLVTNQTYLYCAYSYYHANTKVNYNYYHDISYSGTSTTPYLYLSYMYYGNGAIQINNNTVQDINWLYYIYGFYNYYPNYNAGFSHQINEQYNTIQRVKTGGTGYLYAFYNYGYSSYPGKIFFNFNTIKDVDINYYAYLTYIYYLNNSSITDNSFTNVLQKPAATAGYIYTMQVGYSDSSVIANNKFVNLRAYYGIYGIYNYYTSYSTIKNNEIGNLYTTYTGSYYPVNGILLYGTTTLGARYGHGVTVNNNSIYNINNCNYSNTPTSTSNPIGIGVYSTLNHKIYYNSVNMAGAQGGSSASPSFSAALWVYSTSSTGLDIRNNVFSNTASNLGAGSKHYAVYFPSGFNFATSTINYNYYYANGTYNILGTNGTDQTTIAAWRTATSQDVNSNFADPLFNASNILPPKFGSPLLASGTPIAGFSTDLLNVSRSATTPSIGAYENAGDFAGPDIIYTALTNTTSNTSRDLTGVTVTDPSIVNTTTFKPRLYYRLSTANNTYVDNTSATNGWKYVETSSASSPFNFTIDYTKLNGTVSGGTSIEYFVVAQDLATTPNVGVNKGTFAVQPTSVALSSTAFPVSGVNSYKIMNPFPAGTYTVGTGGNYPSLTNNGGLFNALEYGMLSGNIVVNIISDLTSETGTWVLPKWSETGAGNYTMTITTNAPVLRTISGSVAGSLIKVRGSNVIIDGRFSGSGRYLKFNNTAASGTVAAVHFSANAVGINNSSIKYCYASTGFNAASTSIGIYVGDETITVSGGGSNISNIMIDNNIVTKAYYGIYVGGSASVLGQFVTISNNTVGSTVSSDYVLYRGITSYYLNNPIITKNTVFNMIHPSTSTNTNIAAIEFLGGGTGGEVSYNKITGIIQASSGGWGAYGINIAAGTGITMHNNMISDIATMNYSATSTTYNPFGIRITAGSGHKMYNNTIYMQGTQPNVGTAASLTACILITGSYTGLELKNNILSNSLAGKAGTQSFGIYAYVASPSTLFNANDYNVYYGGGTYGYPAGYNTTSPFTTITDIATMQSIYGGNTNSKIKNVSFIDSANVHLNNASITDTELFAPTIAGANLDFDGETRPASSQMGADIVSFTIGLQTDLTVGPDNPAYCVGDSVAAWFEPKISNYSDGIARTYNASFTTKWYKDGAEITALANYLSFYVKPIQQSDSANYYATYSLNGQTNSTSTRLFKVETPISLTLQPKASESVCSNSSNLTLNAAATGTILGYQWQKENPTGSGTWVNLAGATNPILSITVANAQSAIGNYRMQTFGPGNCGPATITTSVANVQVTDPITSFTATNDVADLKNICINTTFHLTSTSNGTVYGVKWQYLNGGTWTDLKTSEFPTANTNTLEIKYAQPGQSGKYRAVFNGSVACNNVATPGPEFDVVIWPLFAVKEHPSTQLLCEGGQFTLRTIVDGTIYGYKWYKDGLPITESTEAIGTTSALLTIKNSKFPTSGLYSVQLDIEDCSGRRFIFSNPALVYVVSKTIITKKPVTQNVALTGVAVFEVQAHVEGAPADYKSTVQWYKGTKALVDDMRITGSKSSILAIDNIQASDLGEDYWVVVKGLCSSDTLRGFGLRQSTVSITGQDVNISTCEGTNAILKVQATSNAGNDKINYQWFKGTTALTNGAKYTGVNTASLTIINPATTDEATNYNCIASVNPGPVTATSIDVNFKVQLKPTIATQPTANLSVQTAKEIKLSVVAAGTDPFTYQWFKNGTAISGAISADFSIATAATTDAGVYYCVVTNGCGTIQSGNSTVVVTFKDMTGIIETNEFGLSAEPNPLTSNTRILFNVKESGAYRLTLTDIFGKEVSVISNTELEAGNHTMSFNAENSMIASGTYYLTLTNGTLRSTIKVIIVK